MNPGPDQDFDLIASISGDHVERLDHCDATRIIHYRDAMRTTLSLDDDVMVEARVLARATGRSLGAVVSDLARRGLAPIGIWEVDGLPVFDVPAEAQAITDAKVAAALDE